MSQEFLEYFGRRIQIKRRQRQRSMRLHVKEAGRILVTTNLTTSHKSILNFVATSWGWIEKSESEILTKQISYSDGEALLFLGLVRTLRLHPTVFSPAKVELTGNVISISGKDLSPANVRNTLRKFYRNEAQPILLKRVSYHSQKMNLRPLKLSFRCQRGRWGSCSSKGSISLNWRLLGAPLYVMDYVIVHELAHLEEANHSERFWRLVEKHYPNFKDAEKWLKKHSQELDFLLPKVSD